jgi:MerR family transcriptional regulator, light-induced transcriptional regulator
VDLREAAARLGVHYQTAYKWVRDGSLPAAKRGSSYEIDGAEVERLRLSRLQPTSPPAIVEVRDWAHQQDRLHEALVSGDELGARAIVERLHEGGTPAMAIMEQLFTPTLRRIGDDWAAGSISVAVEHRASAICERVLARIAPHPRGRPRGVAVVATLPGDEHGLPASMAAVALRADRWKVHHLGTEVPVSDLIDLATTVAAHLVVLSVTLPSSPTTIEEVTRAVHPVPVLVGAPGRSLPELVTAARSRRDPVA